MSELTKEFFISHLDERFAEQDKKIDKKWGVFDEKLSSFDQRLISFDQKLTVFDKRLVGLDKKIETTKTEIIAHIDDLAGMTKREFDSLDTNIRQGFKDIHDRLDVRDRVSTLEKDMTKIKGSLNLNGI